MNIFSKFWQKICVPLDGFLWHRDITHHLVRPALRNQILITGAAILAGALFYAVFPWLFWFGAGLACITWIFWSWAKFFLNADLENFSAAFLKAILLRFFGRLIIIAILIYIALAFCNGSATGIVAGMIAGCFISLASYAWHMDFNRRS